MGSVAGKDNGLNVDEVGIEEVLPKDVDHKQGSADDRANMWRMGKTQELNRDFGLVSIFGFSMILMCSWESVLSMTYQGLQDGGTAGLIWIFFISWIGFMFVNTSMAEMGSMAPTSGGQYHWVSEIAPRPSQKFLSYLMGWLCVLGWQALTASGAFIMGTQLQGLLVLNYPWYVPENWHGTLITIAISGVAVIFNTVLAKDLPVVEGIVLVIHIFAFIGILVTLWVISPMADAKTVFTTFSDLGGWGSLGGSSLIGITGAILPLLGADAAVHMSEEIQNASTAIPQSMVWTTAVNGAMGWVMLITFCFSVATMNLTEVLESETSYPFMTVFYNATGSASSATAMIVWLNIIGLFSNLSILATASRQIFAFARDGAVPFSPWLCRVSPRWKLPLNSVFFTFAMTCLLSLINLGSTTALKSITSLSTNALLSSYMCSIGCLIWRRATNQPLLPSKFSLGKWGLAVNIIAEIYLAVAFVLTFFPVDNNPTPESMNWNILIYGAVIVFSLMYYVFRGRKRYAGPVEYVRKLE